VEGLSLIISISVFSTDDVCMGITLSSPRGLIKQLRISLKSTSNCAGSCSFCQVVINFDFLHRKLSVGIWFSSGVWLEISLSERSGPLFIKAWMRVKHRGFTVSSEEVWSRFVECSLVSFELGGFEAIGCLLELILFVDASSRDLGVASSELGIALLTWDETSVFRNGVVSKRNWVLIAHVLIMGSVHMVITPGSSTAIEIVVESIFINRRRSPLPLGFGEQ